MFNPQITRSAKLYFRMREKKKIKRGGEKNVKKLPPSRSPKIPPSNISPIF